MQEEIDVALIDCANPGEPLGLDPVKGTEWQRRLKEAKLSQKRLAVILGVSENTVSRQMMGEWEVPGYVEAAVTAWEIMSESEREDWQAQLRRERREK